MQIYKIGFRDCISIRLNPLLCSVMKTKMFLRVNGGQPAEGPKGLRRVVQGSKQRSFALILMYQPHHGDGKNPRVLTRLAKVELC